MDLTDPIEIGKYVMAQLNISENEHEKLYDILNFEVLQKLLRHKFKKIFNCTTYIFLRKCYPTWKFRSWSFKSPLKHQWTDKENRRFAIEYIYEQEGWTTRHDFYKLNVEMINRHLGKGFMDNYKGIYDLLIDLFPPSDPTNKWADDNWLPWKLGEQSELTEGGRRRCRSTPKGTWEDLDTQKFYIEWLMKEKGYTFPDDLHKLVKKDFGENYGMGMLTKYYDCCIHRCLISLFPEHSDKLEWFMFPRKPTNSFVKADTLELIRAFKWYRERIGWTTPQDFYDLSRQDFAEYGIIGFIRHNSFAKSIIELNPDLTFDEKMFTRHKTERLVKSYLEKFGFEFDDFQIIYVSSSGGKFRMDIFIPSLNLYIEIDGDQHFKGLRLGAYFQSMGWEVSVCRDVFKMKEALKKGMSVLRLIQVEAWNGKEEWFKTNILPHIKKYTEPQIIHITTSDKYKDAYCHHKEFMEKDICEDDMYI